MIKKMLDIKTINENVQKELNIENKLATPKIEKVVVACGIGSLSAGKGVKNFDEVLENIRVITGQKPVLLKSKKAVSNFKLRIGLPIMIKVTLRGQKAYDFMERLVKVIFPRVRDFEGISSKKFDKHANLNIGFKSYEIFPEINPDNLNLDVGLQITIVTTTDDVNKSKALLKKIGFIFKD